MDTNDRPRKKLSKEGYAASRRNARVSRGVRAGELKGKPRNDEDRAAPKKIGLAAARRTPSGAEQSPSRRKDLPLPMERPDRVDRQEARSLRLTLRVEGERMTVVDAIEVDAPPSALQPVRGSTFLEVRAGGRVVALERLVDPGVAIGIPDHRDKEEFRGHREIVLPYYEVAIRVPLDAMETTALPTEGRRTDLQPIEATIYRATEIMELDPIRLEADTSARRRLTRAAQTGPLGVDELRGASRSENRKAEPRQQS